MMNPPTRTPTVPPIPLIKPSNKPAWPVENPYERARNAGVHHRRPQLQNVHTVAPMSVCSSAFCDMAKRHRSRTVLEWSAVLDEPLRAGSRNENRTSGARTRLGKARPRNADRHPKDSPM